MRFFGRRTARADAAAPPPPPDPDLVRWVEVAAATADRLGVAGRLVVAVLGESLVPNRPSYWFGYEPSADGLERLLTALDEDPTGAAELVAAEAPLAGRRLGVLPEDVRAEWARRASAAVEEARSSLHLPPRDPAHRAAEEVWRGSAAAVQDWRAVQLHPDRALGQLRWFPGCATRTYVGYSDPLDVGAVQRAVEEHRYSAPEREAVLAAAAAPGPVDPLVWRLSSLSFVLEEGRWPAT